MDGSRQIEAFEFKTSDRWDNSNWPIWMHQAWNVEVGEGGAIWCNGGGSPIYVGMMHGGFQLVQYGHFLINHGSDEIYISSPDAFNMRYTR